MKLRPAVNLIWRALFAGLGLLLLLISPGGSPAAQGATLNQLNVSNPKCVQSRVDSGACTISISGISAIGSPDASLTYITISINGKMRANMQGFFEYYGYLYSTMMPNGLNVACGRPGDGGDPNYGSLYTVQVQANIYGGSPYVDTANVYCPYYDGKVFLPDVVR